MTEVNNAVEPSVTEEDVRLLIKRKEDIEEQIKAYYDMLQAVSSNHRYFYVDLNMLSFRLEKDRLLCWLP